MVNSFGFERGTPSDPAGDCSRCESADSMENSRYCEGCAKHMASLTA